MQDPNLQIIEGTNPAKNLNRIQDMQKNIEAVRAEFIGKPEVCHMLVAEIIKLRRNPGNQTARETFWELLNNYTDVILENYDVRWMLSICDTVVDIGDELLVANLITGVVVLSNFDVIDNAKTYCNRIG